MMIQFLKAINFSVWQVVVVFFLIYFRSEIKGLICTLASIKIGDNELSFNPKKEVVEELKNLKELAKNSEEKESKEKYISCIDNLIQKKYIGSLINIKNNTSLLWDKLTARGNSGSITSKIRNSTLESIESDLSLLAEGEYFKYTVKNRHSFSAASFQGVVEIEIFQISQEFDDIIEKAKQY